MKRNLMCLTLGFSVEAAVMLMVLPAFAQKNPERTVSLARRTRIRVGRWMPTSEDKV
jgi:hypothetical protein